MSPKIRHLGILLGACAVLVALDLWLKVWASANLANGPPQVLLPGILGLTYTHNFGIAFGLFGGLSLGWILSIITAMVLCVIAWLYFRLPDERRFWFARIPMILIMAGGLGNLIDRIWQGGSVRDMLEFLFMNFFIFNLADVFVTVGCFALIFVNLFVIKDLLPDK